MNAYNRFIDGNTLPKYEEEYQPKPTEVKRKKKKISANTKAFYKIYMVGFFVAIFTVVFRYTVITEMNSQVRGLNNELARLEKEVQQSTVSLEAMTDLNTVQTTAQNELGMSTPQQHQVIEIDLDMGNKAVSAKKSAKTGKSFFSAIAAKCMEYLY